MDDPYTFGQSAATNALSDVYNGREPKLVMNIVCFRPKRWTSGSLRKSLRAASRNAEAGAIIVGGHSVRQRTQIRSFSYRPGSPGQTCYQQRGAARRCWCASKPIGTGLVMTAVRAGMDQAGELAAAAASMAT